MSKCEHKVVRRFSLKTWKLMNSLCPTDRANKQRPLVDRSPDSHSIMYGTLPYIYIYISLSTRFCKRFPTFAPCIRP